MNIVLPHRKIAREVKSTDWDRVAKESEEMFALIKADTKGERVAIALAHPQVESEDPLRFFVIAGGNVIVNPKFMQRSDERVSGLEGCMSYPDKEMIEVSRPKHCMVCYEIFDLNTREARGAVRALDDLDARVFQHEMDHLDAKYIYD